MKKLNLVTAIVGLAIFAGVTAKEGPMILGMELKHLCGNTLRTPAPRRRGEIGSEVAGTTQGMRD